MKLLNVRYLIRQINCDLRLGAWVVGNLTGVVRRRLRWSPGAIFMPVFSDFMRRLDLCHCQNPKLQETDKRR
jgi:hypothetical protein